MNRGRRNGTRHLTTREAMRRMMRESKHRRRIATQTANNFERGDKIMRRRRVKSERLNKSVRRRHLERSAYPEEGIDYLASELAAAIGHEVEEMELSDIPDPEEAVGAVREIIEDYKHESDDPNFDWRSFLADLKEVCETQAVKLQDYADEFRRDSGQVIRKAEKNPPRYRD